jgi:multisubunit Na+/H+ antiporter MnhE subunit
VVSVRLARIFEVLFWWGACLGVWLVSLSAVSGQELLVAVLVSFPCGVVALVGRLAASNRWDFDPGWFRGAVVLPFAIVNDAVQVLVRVLHERGGGGDFVKIRITEGAGDSPRAEGRRAVATFLATMTPASIVADVDTETGDALVHVIRVRGPHMEQVAAR